MFALCGMLGMRKELHAWSPRILFAAEGEGKMSKEHDLMVLRRDVPAHGLKAGDVGVVVGVYPEGGLEVEFVNGGRPLWQS